MSELLSTTGMQWRFALPSQRLFLLTTCWATWLGLMEAVPCRLPLRQTINLAQIMFWKTTIHATAFHKTASWASRSMTRKVSSHLYIACWHFTSQYARKHSDVLTLLFCTSERRALTRFSMAHSFDKLLSCRRIMMGPPARPRVTADALADNLADNQASDVATNMAAAAQPNLSYTSMCWASYRDLAKLKLISAPYNCWWWGCLQIWWTNLQIHDSVRLSWQVTIEPSDCSWAFKLSLQFSQELTICQRADTLQPSWQSAIC